jgi:hypothetical protein
MTKFTRRQKLWHKDTGEVNSTSRNYSDCIDWCSFDSQPPREPSSFKPGAPLFGAIQLVRSMAERWNVPAVFLWGDDSVEAITSFDEFGLIRKKWTLVPQMTSMGSDFENFQVVHTEVLEQLDPLAARDEGSLPLFRSFFSGPLASLMTGISGVSTQNLALRFPGQTISITSSVTIAFKGRVKMQRQIFGPFGVPGVITDMNDTEVASWEDTIKAELGVEFGLIEIDS